MGVDVNCSPMLMKGTRLEKEAHVHLSKIEQGFGGEKKPHTNVTRLGKIGKISFPCKQQTITIIIQR